ncbi:MAG: hypothetical protein M3451_07015, partial [Chloroflexota bacterium]|nr:hypothetical protein [Chloroflexota bacterium]
MSERDVSSTIAIAGIRAKLALARDHADRLNQEFGIFCRDVEPSSFRQIIDAKRKAVSIVVDEPHPMPVSWSAILGEMLHDLRSSLDHCVYQIIQARTGRRHDGSAFPIRNIRAEFLSDRVQNQIEGVGDGARAFIEWCQPFDYDTRTRAVLSLVNRLWNRDKHRVIRPWVWIVESGNVTADPPARSIKIRIGQILTPGAEIARLLY